MFNTVLRLRNDNTIPVGTTPTQLWSDRERKLLKKINKTFTTSRRSSARVRFDKLNLYRSQVPNVKSAVVQTIRVRPGFDTRPGGFQYRVRTRLAYNVCVRRRCSVVVLISPQSLWSRYIFSIAPTPAHRLWQKRKKKKS